MLISPKAQELFNEALTLAPEQRERFLVDACGENASLFDEVSSLLTAANQSEAYFDDLSSQVSLSALAGAEDGDVKGKVLGQWRLVRLLGRGGMGSVYLAERADGQFEKQVALKTLPIGFDNDLARTRFINERQILARLVHNNIARLLDGGVSSDGTPYFVMDYVEGIRIDEYCDTHECSVGQCVSLLLDVARGVQFAHRNLIIHRDLKPTNILVDTRGHARLLDFGIAKVLETSSDSEVTQLAQRPVTPAFASPEMLRGEAVDVTTDVYALGVILYRLVTGQLPLDVEGKNLVELHSYVSLTEPVAPSKLNSLVDSDLDAILLKSLAKESADRYSTVDNLIQDLSNWQEGMPVRAKAPSPFYKAGKFVRRNLLGVSLASLAILSLVGFATFATYSAARSEKQALAIAEERDRAESVKDFLVSIFDAAGPKAGGETITAAQLLEAGRERVNEELSDQPRLKADMLQIIGNVYGAIGRPDKLRDLLDEGRPVVEQLEGRNSEPYFQLLLALAEAEDMLGHYDESEAIAEELIEIGRALGDGASEGEARGRLGRMMHLRGDYAGADREYRASLKLLQDTLGDDNMRTAASKLHLATLLDHTQKHQEAYDLFVEIEATHERVKKDREVLEVDLYLGTGRALANLGRRDEALEIFQRALDSNTQVYGKDFSHNLYLVNAMSNVVEDQGDYERALELQREVMRLVKLHTPDSPNLGRSMASMARIYQISGRCELAEPLFRQALDVFAQKLPEHAINGQTKWRLGVCLAEFGEVEAAEALMIEANDILAQRLAIDHRERVKARAAAAEFFMSLGKTDMAQAYQ